ncbi:MAG: FAD-dependent oxidoreductase [Pirellulales bacterium]
MQRRDFLSAGIGLGTYSVFVKVDGLSAAAAAQPKAEYTADDIRKHLETIAPTEGRTPSKSEPHMTVVDLKTDVLVCGGGMAGVCAAIAAARNGAKVVLVQDRSRLGGNASSEVKMHIVGADNHGSRRGWREGGILEELRLENAVINPQRSWEVWDLLLYDKVISEPNITLLLDSAVYSAEVKDDAIQVAWVRSDKTEHIYKIVAQTYVDSTGDSRLALEAGAEMRWGKEPREMYNEPLAPKVANRETLGSSILFTSKKHDKPMPFKAPKWARKSAPRILKPVRSVLGNTAIGGSNGAVCKTRSPITNAFASSCWESSSACGIT